MRLPPVSPTRRRTRRPTGSACPAASGCSPSSTVPRVFENELLTGPVAELCEEALATGEAASWFFIRYADPDPHLRLRFRGDPDRLTG